ncbi:YczE/YyaS/YitT family protein [Paenisporosarcina antarctica]|uniref:Membrane protein n=1 Tax=Paenisporosarcina antarctica TaxID=417367 RepID=A0A4P7A132_9BACL|nr:membrane protein [Paenisporosarcina antarctica]QBP42373.1 membrane protein [Paenisporosarcina antarctica]
MKNRLIIAIFYLVGLTFLSLGISLIILADLGAGAWDAMYVGLNEHFGLSIGTWIFIIGILLIFINALLLKERIDVSAVIPVVTIGFLIDFWLLFVFDDFQVLVLAIQVAMLVGGVAIIAVGIACYLQSKIARNPMDTLMIAIQTITGKSMAVSKTMMELGVLIIAFILGGPIGFGTIFVTLLIGPMIQLFYSPVTKLRHRLCEDADRGPVKVNS